jgi:hypothetical protein
MENCFTDFAQSSPVALDHSLLFDTGQKNSMIQTLPFVFNRFFHFNLYALMIGHVEKAHQG